MRLLLAARAGEKRRHGGWNGGRSGDPEDKTKRRRVRDVQAKRESLVEAARTGSEPDEGWDRALIWASKNGFVDVVRQFLKYRRGDPAASNSLAIRTASAMGHDRVVKVLLSSGSVDPAAKENEALREASANGHVNVVDVLLAGDYDTEGRPVDPSEKSSEALFRASAAGHTEVVKSLLEDGRSDPSAMGARALIDASANGYADIVRLLMEHEDVDPSVQQNRALREAIKNNHGNVVEILMTNEDVRSGARRIFAELQGTMKILSRLAALEESGGTSDAGEDRETQELPEDDQDENTWWSWMRTMGAMMIPFAALPTAAAFMLTLVRVYHNYENSKEALVGLGLDESSAEMSSAVATFGSEFLRDASDAKLEEMGMTSLRHADLMGAGFLRGAKYLEKKAQEALPPGEKTTSEKLVASFTKHAMEEVDDGDGTMPWFS